MESFIIEILFRLKGNNNLIILSRFLNFIKIKCPLNLRVGNILVFLFGSIYLGAKTKIL